MSGNFTINAVDDGIIGKDSVGKGFVAVEGGTYHITSGTDGIQAATAITTGGGNYAIITGGGSINGTNNSNSEKNTGSWGNTPASVDGTSSATLNGTSSSNTIDDSTSAKALKAGADISILGGEFTIDSKDDALHSNNNISINNGTLTITSGD
ncbi:MAG: dockerin type 1, partial [Anaerocolumna sp.]|nr:dockerin type 1 [Anaerocolumna sp.]